MSNGDGTSTDTSSSQSDTGNGNSYSYGDTNVYSGNFGDTNSNNNDYTGQTGVTDAGYTSHDPYAGGEYAPTYDVGQSFSQTDQLLSQPYRDQPTPTPADFRSGGGIGSSSFDPFAYVASFFKPSTEALPGYGQGSYGADIAEYGATGNPDYWGIVTAPGTGYGQGSYGADVEGAGAVGNPNYWGIGIAPPKAPTAPGTLASITSLPNAKTRADLNLNPGNIGWGAWAKAHGAIGGAGTDSGHLVAVFPTAQAGFDAMAALALSKYNSGQTTLNELIAGTNGWTPGYAPAAQNIAATMGISPSEDLKLTDPARMQSFQVALATQEGAPQLVQAFKGAGTQTASSGTTIFPGFSIPTPWGTVSLPKVTTAGLSLPSSADVKTAVTNRVIAGMFGGGGGGLPPSSTSGKSSGLDPTPSNANAPQAGLLAPAAYANGVVGGTPGLKPGIIPASWIVPPDPSHGFPGLSSSLFGPEVDAFFTNMNQAFSYLTLENIVAILLIIFLLYTATRTLTA